MPNWCYTTVTITGDKTQAQELLNIINNTLKQPPLIESDFGSSWLGNLLAQFNINYEEQNIRCKGSFLPAEPYNKDGVLITAETALNERPVIETISTIIQQNFPKLTNIKWYAEEPENCYFVTNDPDYKISNGKWRTEIYFRDTNDVFTTQTLQEALRIVTQVTHRYPESLEALDILQTEFEITDPNSVVGINEITLEEEL